MLLTETALPVRLVDSTGYIVGLCRLCHLLLKVHSFLQFCVRLPDCAATAEHLHLTAAVLWVIIKIMFSALQILLIWVVHQLANKKLIDPEKYISVELKPACFQKKVRLSSLSCGTCPLLKVHRAANEPTRSSETCMLGEHGMLPTESTRPALTVYLDCVVFAMFWNIYN